MTTTTTTTERDRLEAKWQQQVADDAKDKDAFKAAFPKVGPISSVNVQAIKALATFYKAGYTIEEVSRLFDKQKQ